MSCVPFSLKNKSYSILSSNSFFNYPVNYVICISFLLFYVVYLFIQQLIIIFCDTQNDLINYENKIKIRPEYL